MPEEKTITVNLRVGEIVMLQDTLRRKKGEMDVLVDYQNRIDALNFTPEEQKAIGHTKDRMTGVIRWSDEADDTFTKDVTIDLATARTFVELCKDQANKGEVIAANTYVIRAYEKVRNELLKV